MSTQYDLTLNFHLKLTWTAWIRKEDKQNRNSKHICNLNKSLKPVTCSKCDERVVQIITMKTTPESNKNITIIIIINNNNLLIYIALFYTHNDQKRITISKYNNWAKEPIVSPRKSPSEKSDTDYWSNISTMRDSVSSGFPNTKKRVENTKRRTTEYFWRNSRCLDSRWNTVLRVWYIFSIETKTNV